MALVFSSVTFQESAACASTSITRRTTIVSSSTVFCVARPARHPAISVDDFECALRAVAGHQSRRVRIRSVARVVRIHNNILALWQTTSGSAFRTTCPLNEIGVGTRKRRRRAGIAVQDHHRLLWPYRLIPYVIVTRPRTIESSSIGIATCRRLMLSRLASMSSTFVLSMSGDITLEDRSPKVHAHVVLGKADATAHGGHLVEGHFGRRSNS
jgi:hypothetical protein